ncbi:hypothetical protein KKD19_06390 [Patescibacteria group bacterium]|nr:hypothetical protein [Patescibacteria group bacterium]MBU4512831.1 hypothetical protein [Patescibacteria group bacterium]MCG2688576.1 hypothetical protein [Candidatus Parcubacteria bacterium]
MAWAQELKDLVAEIKTSHQDRTKYVNDVKKDTHQLIARFQDELKEMTKELKDFLAKSEEMRKKDFETMMKAIQTRVKDIKGDTDSLLARFDKEMKELAAELKDFLAKSEEKRMTDFRALMRDTKATVEAIEKATKALLGDYKAERKEAAGYWAGLGERGKEKKPGARKEKKEEEE